MGVLPAGEGVQPVLRGAGGQGKAVQVHPIKPTFKAQELTA